jgi:hypothetical protein
MNQLQPFARVPSRAAKAARRSNSSLDPRRAAPSFIVNDQVQMGTDTALGRRWGMCRLAPALGGTGRFGGQGCITRRMTAPRGVYDLLPTGAGFGSRLFRPADGRRANAFLAIQCRRQGVLKRSAERLPSHLQNLRLDRSNPISGAKNAVPHTRVSGTPNDC